MPEEKHDGAAPAAPAQPAPEPDLEERQKGFQRELGQLLGKYEMALGASASLTPDGRVQANVVILSARQIQAQQQQRQAAAPSAGLSE